jgi:hypothetical protein
MLNFIETTHWSRTDGRTDGGNDYFYRVESRCFITTWAGAHFESIMRFLVGAAYVAKFHEKFIVIILILWFCNSSLSSDNHVSFVCQLLEDWLTRKHILYQWTFSGVTFSRLDYVRLCRNGSEHLLLKVHDIPHVLTAFISTTIYIIHIQLAYGLCEYIDKITIGVQSRNTCKSFIGLWNSVSIVNIVAW